MAEDAEHINSMRTFILFLLFPISLIAQPPYRGGVNDGHAMTELKNVTVQSVADHHISSFTFFPNPAVSGESITISGRFSEATMLTILSADGRLVYKEKINKASTISTAGLSKGLYMVVLRSKELFTVKRLIIQ